MTEEQQAVATAQKVNAFLAGEGIDSHTAIIAAALVIGALLGARQAKRGFLGHEFDAIVKQIEDARDSSVADLNVRSLDRPLPIIHCTALRKPRRPAALDGPPPAALANEILALFRTKETPRSTAAFVCAIAGGAIHGLIEHETGAVLDGAAQATHDLFEKYRREHREKGGQP